MSYELDEIVSIQRRIDFRLNYGRAALSAHFLYTLEDLITLWVIHAASDAMEIIALEALEVS